MKYKTGSCQALLCAAFACFGLLGCGGGENGSGGASASMATGVGAIKSVNEVASAKEAMQSDGAASLIEAQQSSDAGLDRRAATALSDGQDPRNGVYYLYAADGTNGTRQKLGINFDTRSYTLTDSRGQATSGTFSEDRAEPGTYVFASNRVTSAVNTARFRLTADAVVGAFPFEKQWSNPLTYQVMPFVAPRAFVTDPAQLDGTYNSFGVIRNSDGTSDSQVLPMRITGHGTTLETCFDNDPIFGFEYCRSGSKRTYAITASPDFAWTGTSSSSTDVLQFRMARIGGHNIWLSGGSIDTPPNMRVFQVGLKNAVDWSTARYIGASTEGSWGANVFDVWNSVRTAVTPEGSVNELSLPLSSIGKPQGIRLLNSPGTKRYYEMHNDALSVVVGLPASTTRGYMEVNLFKDSWDARNGHYTVFTTNGTEQTLDIDFDKKLYTMTGLGGDAVAGTFHEDPSDPGTYIFASTRITAASNTARFRTKTGAIVGSFPFAIFKADPAAYAVQPFIAARSFVTDRNELAGMYDVLIAAAGRNNSPHPAAYWQFSINAQGTTARQCTASTEISGCAQPAFDDAEYTISTGSSPGIWLLTNKAGVTTFSVRVARIGGRNVMLSAIESASPMLYPNPPSPIWILLTGLHQPIGGSPSVNWPAMRMHSVSTEATFGMASTDTDRYASNYARPDGTSSSLVLALESNTGNFQIREGRDSDGARYTLIQNGVIMLMMTPFPSLRLHIGLSD